MLQERWSCTYEGRAGARAHATFATAEEARQFAERHALASGTAGNWRESDGVWVLTTPLGGYFVSQAGETRDPAPVVGRTQLSAHLARLTSPT